LKSAPGAVEFENAGRISRDCALHCIMVRRTINAMKETIYRIWPPAVLACGAIATAAWVTLLSYGLFELGGLAF
jgi:hypothetical protein